MEHRDIKPANIMVNRRGGASDVVKVLDFGLVKAIDEQKQSSVSSNTLTGTPLYMSPEAIQSPALVDHRSDLYAVGAVGYFLLTGRPVFDADGIVELCQKHVSESPIPPSELVDFQISTAVENAIMGCLDKMPSRRPQTARELAQLVNRSPVAYEWTLDEADTWWGRHERGHDSATAVSDLLKSKPRDRETTDGDFDHTVIGDV